MRTARLLPASGCRRHDYEGVDAGTQSQAVRVVYCKERRMIGMLIVVLFAALVYIILAALTGSAIVAIVGAVLVLLAGLPTGGFGLGGRFGGGRVGGGRVGGGRLGGRGPRY
jgi:1,4-dihydroxy-2-naphthoate octaprenyltransferase